MPMPKPDDPNVVIRPVELPPVQTPHDWRTWPDDAKRAFIKELEWRIQISQPLPYFDLARPKQLPPDHPRHHEPDDDGNVCGCTGVDNDYSVWLMMAGRGIGKTWTGSNWIISQARDTPDAQFAVLAPTYRDVQETCFTNGILPILNAAKIEYKYRRNELQIRLPNGSIIYGFSADQPERIRGTNLSGAWCDELGSWRYRQTWDDGLMPALRKGHHPRVIVTTTPRPTDLMIDLVRNGVEDGFVHLTRGSMYENKANLSAIALASLEKRYAGTRIGRQELDGELLTETEGALWTVDMIDSYRLKGKFLDAKGDWIDDLDRINLIRVVVAIDPAVTSGPDSDETGIVVVGMDVQGHGYILADLTMKGTPLACLKEAIKAYHLWHADSLVAEVNNGGDYIVSLLRTINTNIPMRIVRATRGKALRAEPVTSLYEQGRVHHYGVFPLLEDQMTTWVPGVSKKSPDRVDALVWGITELKGLTAGDYSTAYGTVNCVHCGRGYVAASHPVNCPHCKKRQVSAGLTVP